MRRIPVMALLVAASLGCGGVGEPGAGSGASTGSPNILLITLDTLRADRLGSYGYAGARTPHLDALAGRGLRFSQATTVMPLTLPAHASLMTGTFPAYHGVRDNGGFYLGEDAVTLAEVLRGSGYRTGGFVGAFVLDSRWGIGQGFERFFDDFDLTEFNDAPGMDAIQRPGSVVVDQALDWLRSTAPADGGDARPFLAWIHLYDPHTPYQAPEPFRSRFPATASGAYDAEIAYTDNQVGRLLAALEEDGRLENTLIAVLSDHGEMLGEHGEPTHGFFIYDAAVRIPMLLAGPGIPVAEITEQVRIVDLRPTLLTRLGLELPSAVQGADLLAAAGGEQLRLAGLSESWFPRFHYGWSELTSIQDGRYKLIRAPRRELYDLIADPGEEADLAVEQPEIADRLEAALLSMLEEMAGPETQAAPQPVDAETAAKLQALGYLGSGSRHLDDDGRPRADPKDKIGLYNLLKQATASAALGEMEQAISTVRRALVEDPGIVEGHLLHGNFLRKSERYGDAVAAFQAALDLDAEHHEALYSLALAYKEMGRLEDAQAGLERAADLDPRNGKVLWQLADLAMRQGRFADAETRLLRALDLDLDRARFLLKLGECYLEMGRLDDAQRRLLGARAENPELVTVSFNLGLVHEERGQTERAIEEYRKEVVANAGAYRASFNLAKLLQQKGRRQEALGLFRQTVEIQPQFGTGHLYLAKALLDEGDLEAAEAAARRGLERRPEPRLAPLGHFVLADVYNRQGRLEEAAREEAAGRRLQSASDRKGRR